jgi:predicted flavoprotein YhiN
MAAETLARGGARVVVHERMPSSARRLLMAGRGGLNLTHSEGLTEMIARYGDRSGTLAPLLEAFPPQALRDWAEGLGQDTFVGSSGRVFPRRLKASPLVRAWLARLDSLGVELRLRSTWMGWDREGRPTFRQAGGEDAPEAADALLTDRPAIWRCA